MRVALLQVDPTVGDLAGNASRLIALAGLAADIAQKVSDEVVFPGQVKVTVIREFRAEEVAA